MRKLAGRAGPCILVVKNFHQSGFRNSDLSGFPEVEIYLIATCAKYFGIR
jgi:hypothetical protein